MSKGNSNETNRTDRGASKTPEQRTFRNRLRGIGEEADWGKASAQVVLGVVVAITQHGFTCQFGYKRDQSEYTLRVWGDGDAYTEYLRPSEDVDLWLEGFRLDYSLDGTRPDIKPEAK